MDTVYRCVHDVGSHPGLPPRPLRCTTDVFCRRDHLLRDMLETLTAALASAYAIRYDVCAASFMGPLQGLNPLLTPFERCSFRPLACHTHSIVVAAGSPYTPLPRAHARKSCGAATCLRQYCVVDKCRRNATN